jgi:hypothetical protein
VGKVKTPIGLLNELQDVDPAELWVLLPQSVYPIASRSSVLSHYGGVAYGKIPLGERVGKLEYRAFGGERIINSEDGFFQPLRSQGVTFPSGMAGRTFGGTVRWNPPVQGLLFGASESSGAAAGAFDLNGFSGKMSIRQYRQTFYFGQYEHKRLMLAGEYVRTLVSSVITFPGFPTTPIDNDSRPFYGMASYRLSGKLNAGLYYSSSLDYRAALGSNRYQKDWALTARYDFNPFLYAKAEQHWMDGTEIGFASSDNPNLQPSTRLSLLKLGVSF